MNKNRRKQIKEAIELMTEAKDILNEVLADEEIAYDSLPEQLQETERGENMQSAIENLECSIESLEEAISQSVDAASC